MTIFKVHYETRNGNTKSATINAETPVEAGNYVRKNAPGAIITKIKVSREAATTNHQ